MTQSIAPTTDPSLHCCQPSLWILQCFQTRRHDRAHLQMQNSHFCQKRHCLHRAMTAKLGQWPQPGWKWYQSDRTNKNTMAQAHKWLRKHEGIRSGSRHQQKWLGACHAKPMRQRTHQICTHKISSHEHHQHQGRRLLSRAETGLVYDDCG